MKILVSDFDNTLFTKDYLENIKKINEFVKKGNMFIIATGRNVNHLKKDIQSYNINYSYLICNDGGIIVDKFDNIIYRLDVLKNDVQSLFDFLNKENINEIYIDNGFDYFKDNKTVVNAIIGKIKNRKQTLKTAKKIEKKYPNIFCYLSISWLNIVNKKASKGEAIMFLKNKLNLKKTNIYTVGDEVNDISMNSMFNGYYMKNSPNKKLKKVSIDSVDKVSNLIDIIT